MMRLQPTNVGKLVMDCRTMRTYQDMTGKKRKPAPLRNAVSGEKNVVLVVFNLDAIADTIIKK